MKEWSGRRESNPCLDLGKVPYYRYTTAAQSNRTLTRQRFADKNPQASNAKTIPHAATVADRGRDVQEFSSAEVGTIRSADL